MCEIVDTTVKTLDNGSLSGRLDNFTFFQRLAQDKSEWSGCRSLWVLSKPDEGN